MASVGKFVRLSFLKAYKDALSADLALPERFRSLIWVAQYSDRIPTISVGCRTTIGPNRGKKEQIPSDGRVKAETAVRSGFAPKLQTLGPTRECE